MRIISKQKDYYDGVMGLGMDLDLRYIREPKDEAISFSFFHRASIQPFGGGLHIIGFCGSIYPVVEIYKEFSITTKPENMYYDFEHLDAFMVSNLEGKELDKYKNGKSIWMWTNNNTRKSWQKFFQFYKEDKVKHSQLELFKAPIFVISECNKVTNPRNSFNTNYLITYNPILRPYNFAKIKDPYTAFQEIRMWLSNIAVPMKPIPKLSNEDMAASKGHGDKYSFRKPPTKKR